jgi:hypothetical protein
MKSEIRLRIAGPDGRTRDWVSDQESVTLGSGAGATIRIDDPQVSSLHLMLKAERGGAVKVIDLGSEQGTRVGDRPVREPTSLSPGSVISIGGSRVELLGPPAVDASGAPDAPDAWPPLAQVALSSQPPTRDQHVLQVALIWGDQLLGIRHYADGAPITVGESPRNDFQVFAPSLGDSFTLGSARGGKVALTLPEGAAVTMYAGGRSRPVTGAAALTLDLEESARIDLAHLSLLVRHVAPAPGMVVQRRDQVDHTFFQIAGVCLLAAAALVAAFLIVPSTDTRSADDIFQDHARTVVRLLVKPAARPLKPPPRQPTGVEEGARAKGEEGKFGREEARPEERDPSRPGSPIADVNRKEKDRTSVQKVGLLGAVARLGGRDGASGVFGPGGFGTGLNSAMGGLKGGAGMGDARGFGGLGSRGTGPGAGGTGLGLGGLGTQGGGRGAGGSDEVDLGGLQKERVIVKPGKTIVVGGLSREVIAKVVKSHEREIKYCYEQELTDAPDLAGKVGATWVIGPDGSVTEARVNETTLNNRRAEECIVARIRRWKFPEVPGGGIVNVTYPWVFKPAGTGGEG